MPHKEENTAKYEGVFLKVADKLILSCPIDTLSETKTRDSSPKSEDEHPPFSLWSEIQYWTELGFAIGSNLRSDVLFLR